MSRQGAGTLANPHADHGNLGPQVLDECIHVLRRLELLLVGIV